jgi:hypothetical protein
MTLRTTYTPYNSSWLKFGGFFLLRVVAGSQLPIIYHTHNLYEQYQHNNKLTKAIKLKLEGEEETRRVDMKPNFMDSFTVYNASGLLGCIILGTILQNISQNISGNTFNDFLKLAKDLSEANTSAEREQIRGLFSEALKPFVEPNIGLFSIFLLNSAVVSISKAIHFFSSDEAKYTFTDQKTGELISAEDIIDSEFLGYIN